MAAESIEWHEECLKNSLDAEMRYKAAAEQAFDTFQRCKRENHKLSMQIARAKRLGKKKFDAEKFSEHDKASKLHCRRCGKLLGVHGGCLACAANGPTVLTTTNQGV